MCVVENVPSAVDIAMGGSMVLMVDGVGFGRVSRRGGSRGDDGGDGCLDSRVFSIRLWDDLSDGGNVEFVDASRISMVSIFFLKKI